jgi:predicted Rossmann-fold nucleotide-binding protein
MRRGRTMIRKEEIIAEGKMFIVFGGFGTLEEEGA